MKEFDEIDNEIIRKLDMMDETIKTLEEVAGDAVAEYKATSMSIKYLIDLKNKK